MRKSSLPKPKLELYQRELPFDELEAAPPTKRQTREAIYEMLQRSAAQTAVNSEKQTTNESEVTS